MSVFRPLIDSSALSWKVDGVELLTASTNVANFVPLLVPGERRHSSEVIPFRDGEVAGEQFWAPQVRTLTMDVSGELPAPGMPPTDQRTQLIQWIRWLGVHLFGRVSTGDGCRLWQIHWIDDVHEEGRVAVQRATEVDNTDGVWSTIEFDVLLPNGPLVSP